MLDLILGIWKHEVHRYIRLQFRNLLWMKVIAFELPGGLTKLRFRSGKLWLLNESNNAILSLFF